MSDKSDTQIIHINLDEQSYVVLKQKSSYSRLSMNAYLKELGLNTNIVTHNILVHDLADTAVKISEITFKASGYFNLVSQRDNRYPEVSLDDGDDMIRLFKQLREYLTGYCVDFLKQRSTHMVAETKEIQKIIDDAQRSCYRDLKAVCNSPSNFDLNIRMSTAEKEQLMNNISNTKLFTDDLSRYFRNLIMSKYYVWLKYDLDDVDKIMNNIYDATQYGKHFITMMYHQGYECADQGRELEALYEEVVHNQLELYKMVSNDRLIIYKHFDKKIHEPNGESINRHRIRKEKGLWQ